MNDSLLCLREKIKQKVNKEYSFLDQDGNFIDNEDENDLAIENIIKDKIIKIKSKEDKIESKDSKIKVISNNKNICSIENSTKDNLDELRKIISNSIKEEFYFLDFDGNIIDINDEKEYSIEYILKDNSIKIKIESLENFSDAAPLIETQTSTGSKKLIDKTNKSKKKIEFDFSKYEILEAKHNILTLYKYSNLERVKRDNLVYEYFFDKFDVNDYHNAYVILFCGKTGDGKTTAINALFNIIKGIKNEDNYRFILINEPKKETGQAESQTDGIHLYYIKDYNNKPIIIIDSQGYADTRGKTYDEMINESFRFTFSNIIDHINFVCFITKATDHRINIITKYIFSSVTSLFSEDITENFIILATFADKDTPFNGPGFIESIQKDAEFLKLKDRLDEKWWYAIDSKCILDNDTDRLTIYSFSQLTELYENKIKKLNPKGIKNCAKVLEERYKLKKEINQLKITFKDLSIEINNHKLKEEIINEISLKINEIENKINIFEKEFLKLNPKETYEKIKMFNEELQKKLDALDNEYEYKMLPFIEKTDQYHTMCYKCKSNCHSPCDCNFQSLNRCYIFSWGIISNKICEKCNCSKEDHKLDYNYWVYKKTKVKIPNFRQIKEEKEKRKKEEEDLINKTHVKANKIDKELKKLNNNKSQLLIEKEKNINQKNEIRKKIEDINFKIILILIQLKNIYEKLNDIAMNNNHLVIEIEFIDSLMDKMKEAGIKDNKDNKDINFLQQIKENNKIFMEISKIDIFKLEQSKLAEKLGVIIPFYNTPEEK